jgi:acetyltransferase-like isoleucine patch superfamily enzyme
MKSLLIRLVRLRNPKFDLAPDISLGAIWVFGWIQAWSLFRGLKLILHGKNPKMAILGKGVSFFNSSKISYGRFLKLGNEVFLSGLGKTGLHIGDNVGIGAFSRIVVSTTFNNLGSHIKIGNHVGIGEYAYLGGAGGLEIGDECIIGQYFSCHPENHIAEDLQTSIRHQGVTRKGIKIGNNCWIGSKVTILDGVEIGEGSIIAAGAVVTHSFPKNSVIGGVPAKILKTRT